MNDDDPKKLADKIIADHSAAALAKQAETLEEVLTNHVRPALEALRDQFVAAGHDAGLMDGCGPGELASIGLYVDVNKIINARIRFFRTLTKIGVNIADSRLDQLDEGDFDEFPFTLNHDKQVRRYLNAFLARLDRAG